MKILLLPRVLIAFTALTPVVGLNAQVSAPKAAAVDPAADAAFDAFFKLRDQKDVAPSSARFNQVIKAGLPLLAKYPKHRRVPEVIRRLTDVASGFNDKATLPLRDVWFSNLKLEILNVPGDPLDDDGRAALAALKAANANAEARLSRDKETVEAAREKIDELAAAPGGKRFLADAEMGFIEVMKTRNPDTAEKLARKLTEHPDKGLAGRAADELRIMEVRKAPFDLKVTTLDGKEFDATALRGKKALLIFFWNADNDYGQKLIDQWKDVYAEHGGRLEIVGVNFDTAENRAKAEKVLKDKKAKWPQVVEGVGNKSETAARLSVRNGPRGVLFDQKGILVNADARPWQAAGALKAMGFKF